MATIGPGLDDPENDGYDPAWKEQDTPFRRWIFDHLYAAGEGLLDEWKHAVFVSTTFAPANRYNGIGDAEMTLLALLTNTSYGEVFAAHKADLVHWQAEQQLRNHPDLAVVDADLDRTARRH